MNNRSPCLIGALAVVLLLALSTQATTVDATYDAPTDVPVTANGYTASGNTVEFTLNFAPTIGTELMVVKNTSSDFINGKFSGLPQGQAVRLSFGGIPYNFVANYYGGSGNDLVLVWASTRAFGWGYNLDGQVGDNTTTNHLVPGAVTTTGVLSGKTVVALAAGINHSVALCSDGTLAAWGQNTYGQLGDNTATNRLVPGAVTTAGTPLEGKTVVAIAAGTSHNLALCSDGTLAAWGFNGSGELGDGTMTPRHLPVAASTISALSNKTVIAIAAGDTHSVAACSDGTLASWGYNAFGELGHNTQTQHEDFPLAVITDGTPLAGKTVVALASGIYHTLALCSDGTLAAWCGTGAGNASGQIGNGTSSTAAFVPVAVSTNSALSNKTVVAIAAGSLHSLALCSDGTLAAWGDNYIGQLGDGTQTNRLVPTAVPTAGTPLEGKTIVAIAAGAEYSVALCSDGTMAGWGYNAAGQLGHIGGIAELVPVAVSMAPLAVGERFIRVASGSRSSHTLALVGTSTAPNVIGITPAGTGAVAVKFAGVTGFNYDVEGSTNLVSWNFLESQPAGTNGQFQITDTNTGAYPRRFFRGKAQ